MPPDRQAMCVARQMILDFDAPPPHTRAGRMRRLYVREGEPVPQWLRTLEHLLLMQDEELERSDPLEVRVPVAGDRIEVLIEAKLGWQPATVVWIDYPRWSMMDIRAGGNRDAVVVSRQEWGWKPNIQKGPLWRWPERRGG